MKYKKIAELMIFNHGKKECPLKNRGKFNRRQKYDQTQILCDRSRRIQKRYTNWQSKVEKINDSRLSR